MDSQRFQGAETSGRKNLGQNAGNIQRGAPMEHYGGNPNEQIYHPNAQFTGQQPNANHFQQPPHSYASEFNYGNVQQQVPTRMMPNVDAQQLLNNPMVANMALQYGNELADQGKNIVNQKIEKYMSISRLKYYFAVDTSYVLKKLRILLFPFNHTEWSVQFNKDEPVAPRYDVNSPDLYIPVMALITYILIAGITLGTQDKFTPEQLGIQASSALAWECLTLIIISISMYIMDIMSDLKTFDLIAFSGYKYVGMIAALLGFLASKMMGYYLLLGYTSISIAFFLMRTLRVLILNKPNSSQVQDSSGGKRSLYMLLFISGAQPLLMYWLTSHLVA